MILLDDEEMDREYCLADLDTDKFAHKAIAKAQLKKVVEWLDTFKYYSDWGGESAKAAIDRVRQALLKEVED